MNRDKATNTISYQASLMSKNGENANPNYSLKRHIRMSRIPSSSKTIVNDDSPAKRTQCSCSQLAASMTLHNVVLYLLVKALIIAVLINFHLGSLLSSLDNDSSFSLVGDSENVRNILNPDVLACVRNVGDKCSLYPCINEDGTFVEIDAPDSTFGYAGRFVHRDANVNKSLMRTIGDRGWGSGCVVSDEYKFVYIHVLKSGGTATKEFLRTSLCGADDTDCKRVDPNILRPSGCRAAILNYTGYFTFSFVRNPFSRMYSMYSMMDGFPIDSGQKVTDTFSFHDFVLKPRQRKNHTKMHAGHYDLQKNFIFSNQTCPSFDYLGRVEHYDDDMRTILNHLNATKLITYLDNIGGSVKPANTWGQNKKDSIGGDLRAEYSSNAVKQTVAVVYKTDFDLLGYDKNNVPSN